MERWKGRVALVTGASVGIGAAVARLLVQHGMKVVGCARSVDKIEKLAAECESAGYPGTLIPYKCDVSNEEEILSMFSAIKTLHQGVDVCINNAGLARPEPLLSGKTEGWRTMIDVNVLAVSICTREAYQSMRKRNIDDGQIININSMSGHRVISSPVSHFYSATKYAVTALTEGLRHELREAKTHIRATSISPGLVETEFAFKLHDNDPERAAATYESIKCLKAEDIANSVMYVLCAPPHVQPPWPHIPNWETLSFLQRHKACCDRAYRRRAPRTEGRKPPRLAFHLDWWKQSFFYHVCDSDPAKAAELYSSLKIGDIIIRPTEQKH